MCNWNFAKFIELDLAKSYNNPESYCATLLLSKAGWYFEIMQHQCTILCRIIMMFINMYEMGIGMPHFHPYSKSSLTFTLNE